MATYEPRGGRPLDGRWDAELVRRLRDHLELTQREFAAELNARQQTVSEWETGRYRPRGPSARLLTMIAEDADFGYAQPHENEARQDGVDDSPGTSLAAGSDVADDATGPADDAAGLDDDAVGLDDDAVGLDDDAMGLGDDAMGLGDDAMGLGDDVSGGIVHGPLALRADGERGSE